MNFAMSGHRAAAAALCLSMVLAACGAGTGNGAGAPVPASVEAGGAGPAAAETPVAVAPGVSNRAVVTDTLPYAEVADRLVDGYIAFPADSIEPLPAVILIHEWWGLNDQVKAQAERLAAEGYLVLAVDLFGGEVARSPEEARPLEVAVVESPGLAEENIRQAFEFLKTFEFVRKVEGVPQVATVGFGFGGGWSLNAALLLPEELSACVIYYGQVLSEQEKLAPLNVPVLGLFADGDRAIPVTSVRDFEAAMRALEKDFEIEIFGDARRGFADSQAANYSAELAEQAWNRMLGFLGVHLSSGAG